MRQLHILAATAAALALSACGGGATNEAANQAGNEAEANAAAPADANAATPETAAAEPAAPAGDGTLSQAYMVGRWTDDGDCSAVTEFRADGTFLFPWGDTGQWTLSGDQLTLSGNPSPLTIRVIDQNTMERTSAGGTPHRVTRCT